MGGRGRYDDCMTGLDVHIGVSGLSTVIWIMSDILIWKYEFLNKQLSCVKRTVAVIIFCPRGW
jgi:hypothetical protein